MTLVARLPAFRSAPISHWYSQYSGISTRFTGRTPSAKKLSREEVLGFFDDAPHRLAWVEQYHSATVRQATVGSCGRADALWTETPGLALSIVTADCVPIVCGGEGSIVAIHAGWRGLAGGAIRAALAALPASPATLEAWIGPAIGLCCYEVGPDVAQRVVRSSEPAVAAASETGKPHLDLQRAAEFQLRSLGVEHVHKVETCTRCNSDLLWSYRGCFGTNGRNLTFAWLTEA